MTQRLKRSEQVGGDNEAYETPAWPVRRLLERVALPVGRWLEPCAGTGNIIRACDEFFPQAITWDACEIRKECQHALYTTVSVETLVIGDFLKQRPAGTTERRFEVDCVVSNFPNSKIEAFVEACRRISPIVVALMPTQFFGSAGRENFFKRHTPDSIWLLPDRPQFIDDKSNSLDFAWFYWGPVQRDHRLGTTMHRLAVTPPEERGVKRRGKRATG